MQMPYKIKTYLSFCRYTYFRKTSVWSICICILQLCVILEPMQELMSRHKAYALSPRDCLKTTLFQKWQKMVAPPGKSLTKLTSMSVVNVVEIFQRFDGKHFFFVIQRLNPILFCRNNETYKEPSKAQGSRCCSYRRRWRWTRRRGRRWNKQQKTVSRT